MLTALAALLFPLAALDEPALATATQAEPPVKVWLSRRDGLERGERVRVYVRTAADGYLVVLHAEPAGRVRVLFPLDPGNDNFVRAAEDYELMGRGDREAFAVYESSGLGTVYAAFSRDPFRFDPYVLGDHWDYRLDVWRVTDDAEAELTALVVQLAAGARFEYDLVRYGVGRTVAHGGVGGISASFYDPYYHYGFYGVRSGLSLHLHFGHRHYYHRRFAFFDPVFRCDPFYWRYAYGACYGYYYDPFYYGPFHYDPFYYGYDPFYYGLAYPRYRLPARTVVVPRKYTFKSPVGTHAGRGVEHRRRIEPVNPGERRTVAPPSAEAAGRGAAASGRRAVGGVPNAHPGPRDLPVRIVTPSAPPRRASGVVEAPSGTRIWEVRPGSEAGAPRTRELRPAEPSSLRSGAASRGMVRWAPDARGAPRIIRQSSGSFRSPGAVRPSGGSFAVPRIVRPASPARSSVIRPSSGRPSVSWGGMVRAGVPSVGRRGSPTIGSVGRPSIGRVGRSAPRVSKSVRRR